MRWAEASGTGARSRGCFCHRRATIHCVFAIVAALAATSALAAGDADLLPASGYAGVWQRDGAARLFRGAELYGTIDGGAEIFLEFGFERVTIQRYLARSQEISLALYRMSDPAAALGIYLAKCGKETPDPSFHERHTAGRYQLAFVRERFFAILENPAGVPALAPVLVGFARALAAKLPTSTPVAALALLPKEGQIAGSQRLIRGPVALAELITLGEGDVLQLRGAVTAVAASYSDPNAHTLVLVPYPDAAAAAAGFAFLSRHLDPEIKPLAKTTTQIVFKDYSGRFGDATLAASLITVRLRLAAPPR